MLTPLFASALVRMVSESPQGVGQVLKDDWIGPVFLAVCGIIALKFIMEQAWTKLVLHMAVMGMVGVFIFFGDFLFGVQKTTPPADTTTPTPSPSATSSSVAPSPSPTAVPESHFTVNWGQVAFILLLILAGIILLGLLFFVLFSLLPKWKVSGEVERKRAMAAAEKRKADELAWVELQSQGHALIDRFMSYRTDMNKLLTHPLMISLDDPLTQRATLLMDQCRNQLDGPLPSLGDHETVWATSCGKAVTEFKNALDAAVANAELKKDRNLSPAAQKAFKRARLLWALAEDSAASDEERATAYERVREELKEHVHLPQETTQVLVAGAQRKAITATTDASASTSVSSPSRAAVPS